MGLFEAATSSYRSTERGEGRKSHEGHGRTFRALHVPNSSMCRPFSPLPHVPKIPSSSRSWPNLRAGVMYVRMQAIEDATASARAQAAERIAALQAQVLELQAGG